MLALTDSKFSKDDVGTLLIESFDKSGKVLNCLNHVICYFIILDDPALQKSLIKIPFTIALMA